MKESIIIAIFVIFIYMFFSLNKKSLVLMEASNSGYKFLVHNDKFKKESANTLSEIITRMYKLRNHLVNNKDKFPDFKDSISLLEQNLTQERTNIYENSPNSSYTSYSVNKGEEVVFCLKSKKTGQLHKINLLMYVAIHEMAHIGCHEIGHTELFKKIFEFYTKEAMKIGIYQYEDYDSNPVEYCGMVLSSSIV
tara:strand:+ start:16 stop:597 length:582 start_codon:yes stop_codon:yes gene_type:complete